MLKDYLLVEKFPLFWCSGCGNGIALQAIVRNMDKRNWTRKNTVVATGIGCWGKADDYLSTNRIHGTHGRALPFSTGVKLANPKLNVITIMGDGDGITIGGNHLIHAARRNVDVTAIMVNNLNYGMTGGQYSGTTPKSSLTKTSVYGHVENGFDVCGVVKAAGGSFVARCTVYDVNQLEKIIGQAMDHKGFSFVEIISPCPTHFGRNNKLGDAPAMMKLIKENTISIKQAEGLDFEELRGKFVTGIFENREQEDYSTAYQKIIDGLQIKQKVEDKDEPKEQFIENDVSAAPGRKEITISGVGGQGMILCGTMIANASAINDHKNATLSTEYGTETRGTFAKADVISSDDEIFFPDVTDPDLVVCLHQIAYERYTGKLSEKSKIIYNSDEVTPDLAQSHKEIGIPITKIAKEIGNTAVANIVTLGIIAGYTGVVSHSGAKEQIQSFFGSKSDKILQMNYQAFDKGVEVAKYL
ncbi:thiamine pyrophosphate-dependent enzyme [Peptococcus simiae]|uniref:thiamine pyrophosphate-dependent enzyme n=1 Tax=Peptococcus simiae TaxID=1643805 RepID=UPI00397F6D16